MERCHRRVNAIAARLFRQYPNALLGDAPADALLDERALAKRLPRLRPQTEFGPGGGEGGWVIRRRSTSRHTRRPRSATGRN
jgi:hypothetical protein